MIRLCRKKKWVLVLVVSLALAVAPFSHSLGMNMSMEKGSCMMPVHCSACAVPFSLGIDTNVTLVPSLDAVPVLLAAPTKGIPQSLFHPPKALFL